MKSIITLITATLLTLFSSTVFASGSFFAKNSTDHTVTIWVGNFVPTAYVIRSGQSKLVFVSTDNQNIEIDD